MSSRDGAAAPAVVRQRSWNAAASTMKPGVQNPHCRASCAMKAFCTGCNPPAPTASTVVTDRSAAARAGIRQLTTGTPSSSTVHAPHTPAPHTSFVPVRLSASRTTSISSASGSSGRGSLRPLIVIVLLFDFQVRLMYLRRWHHATLHGADDKRTVEILNLKARRRLRRGRLDLIARKEHPRRAFHDMCDA